MVLASTPQTPATPQHKKRRGQHHRPTKRYAQTYWPYLPMLLVVILGFVLNGFWGMRSGVLGYATNVSTTSLLQETNIRRTSSGYAALAMNEQLSRAAQEKANDMSSRDYWDHVSPEGRQPWQFISAAGYNYTYAGENLAYGFVSSADTVAGWMNSPSHKANILNAHYTDVGFGIAHAASYQGAGEQTVIVAMYGAPQKVAANNIAASQPSSTQQSPTIPPSAIPVTTGTPITGELQSQNVSRFDVLAPGNAGWIGLMASVLITIAAISMVYRHGKTWKRYLIKGEHFIIHHPTLDLAVVALVAAGLILTQTTGFIH